MTLPSGKLRRQFLSSLRPGLTKLVGKAAIGSGGVVATDSTTDTPGFVVTRASAGTYTITLNEKWLGLVGFKVGFLRSSGHTVGEVGDAYAGHLTADSVTSSTPTVTLRVHDAYNVTQDPVDTTMFLELDLRTSEQG